MRDEIYQSWQEFLDPEVLRPRIIRAAILITGFEVLKDAIIGHVKDFYLEGFDEKGYITAPEYKRDVLSRNRSPLYASLDWFKELGAINDEDLSGFERVKECRNHLAHSLPQILFKEGLPLDYDECFNLMFTLLDKIESWWITNVEIPINHDLAGEIIDERDVTSGRIIGLQLLFQIALGSEKESLAYIEEFRKLAAKRDI